MLNIQHNVELAPYTTFQIGGPADYFASVVTAKDVIEALEFAEEHHLPIFFFAGGSNILISDAGFRGMVVHMTNQAIRISHSRVFADAGVSLHDVVQSAIDTGLAGLEKLAGIPGSLGGAIRGNAGAFGSEIGESITNVKCYDCKEKTLRELNRNECQFSYRMSKFKNDPSLIILSATLSLWPGDKEALFSIAMDTVEKRESKHPQSAKCAGSFFMNPKVNDGQLIQEFESDTGTTIRGGVLPAGWLIDHVGLRGKKIGGAQISPLHPNYFVNTGNAKAEDVIMLASLAKQRVRSELGIQLKEEVQFVGF